MNAGSVDEAYKSNGPSPVSNNWGGVVADEVVIRRNAP